MQSETVGRSSRTKRPDLANLTWFARTPECPRRTRPATESTDEIVRKRMVAARNLNRLDQKDAAKLLGYKNSAPLSKIEGGQAKMPKGLLVKASIAYGVSADFLLGLSDEPERDPRTAEHMAVIRSVEESVRQHTHHMATALLRNAAESVPLELHLKQIIETAHRAAEAFDTVCRKNPEFQDDVVAGSRLQAAMDSLVDAIGKSNQYMERRSRLTEVKLDLAVDGMSMPLFADSETEEG